MGSNGKKKFSAKDFGVKSTKGSRPFLGEMVFMLDPKYKKIKDIHSIDELLGAIDTTHLYYYAAFKGLRRCKIKYAIGNIHTCNKHSKTISFENAPSLYIPRDFRCSPTGDVPAIRFMKSPILNSQRSNLSFDRMNSFASGYYQPQVPFYHYNPIPVQMKSPVNNTNIRELENRRTKIASAIAVLQQELTNGDNRVRGWAFISDVLVYLETLFERVNEELKNSQEPCRGSASYSDRAKEAADAFLKNVGVSITPVQHEEKADDGDMGDQVDEINSVSP